MYAIIRQGDGKYYTSVIFGYYASVTATDDYQRYLERVHNRWFIALDDRKTKLIKQPMFPKRDDLILDTRVLLINDDVSDWKTDENGCGAVNFLPEAELLEMAERGEVPEELLRRCIELDAQTSYEPYPEIRTERDIGNFFLVSGCFHDAYIEKLETLENGALYVLFDGIWGCKIEVWFSGDVAYDTESRNPEKYDPYWFGATVLIRDGYVWLIDEEDMTPEEINSGFCWFRAKRMKYHVMPN